MGWPANGAAHHSGDACLLEFYHLAHKCWRHPYQPRFVTVLVVLIAEVGETRFRIERRRRDVYLPTTAGADCKLLVPNDVQDSLIPIIKPARRSPYKHSERVSCDGNGLPHTIERRKCAASDKGLTPAPGRFHGNVRLRQAQISSPQRTRVAAANCLCASATVMRE